MSSKVAHCCRRAKTVIILGAVIRSFLPAAELGAHFGLLAEYCGVRNNTGMFGTVSSKVHTESDPGGDVRDEAPLLQTFLKYADHESMWISLVVEQGDELRRISPYAADAIEIISHVWTWRVVVICCVWYLITSLVAWQINALPLQIALVLASGYLSTAMRFLFRTSFHNENNGTARDLRLKPSLNTWMAYNCCDSFATASSGVQEAKRRAVVVGNSAVILNAYETHDAIFKYIRANHDNFENALRALHDDMKAKRSDGCMDVRTTPNYPEEDGTIQTTALDNDVESQEASTWTWSRDYVVEAQQLDLARLQINQPVVTVINQIFFLPILTALGAIGGIIFMLFLWFSCDDVVSCVVSWQTIPYTILMMMWISGGVTLFVFWRISCETLKCAGLIFIAKLKLNRLGKNLHHYYKSLVTPTSKQFMEEYLLVQTFFNKTSRFFQLHVVIGSFFLILLFILGVWWNVYGGYWVNISIAMLAISSVFLFVLILSCTLANEIAKEIQFTLARSKPGDFVRNIHEEASEDDVNGARNDWKEFTDSNPINFTVYGFAITRTWLASILLTVFSTFLGLFIQKQITGR